MKKSTTHLASCLCLITSGAVAANLVVNGDFESPSVATYASYAPGSTNLTGWSVDQVPSDGVQQLNGAWAAGPSSRYVQLTGGSNYAAGGAVSQWVATTPGVPYLLRLDVATRNQPAHGRVSFGGSSFTFTASSLALNTLSWTVIATNSSTLLDIASDSLVTGQELLIIDNVSVTLTNDVPLPNARVLRTNAPTWLYGSGSSSIQGNIQPQGGGFYQWTGNGQMVWNVFVTTPGAYEVSLCYSADNGAVGQNLVVTGATNNLTYPLQVTKGVFPDGFVAYEQVAIAGALDLNAGYQTVVLRVTNAPSNLHLLNFRNLQLIPTSAKAAIQAEQNLARQSRADTTWLPGAPYGVMFHWTSQSVGTNGVVKPFAQAVADFDVSRFAAMVETTGAGYVLFTVGHAEPYCPAPLQTWENYYPGHTTSRDLIAEIADALNAKGIKLMCYFPTHILGGYPTATSSQFNSTVTNVLAEFGTRYGPKVVGYWFDSVYACYEQYPDFDFEGFFKVCKLGYTNRVIALNAWIYPNVSEWQEYWAGETASPVALPVSGTNARGPGEGLRYQSLIIMEPYWVQEQVYMPPPRFNAQELGAYISRCRANGGAVTINLGIYQNGSVDPRAVDVLQQVRKQIPNLVSNGDFESPIEPNWSQHAAGSTNLTGWTIDSTPSDGVQLGRAGIFSANNGSQNLQLTGGSTYANGGAVSQSIATTPGMVYEVSIDVASRDGSAVTGNFHFGDRNRTLNVSSTSFSNLTWQVPAAASNALIKIVGHPSSATGQLVIDNVVVLPLSPLVAAIQRDGTNIILRWPYGTLQQANFVSGPFTNVPGATSPWTNSPPLANERFFRLAW